MNFVEVDTFSLIGLALDWAVTKCERRSEPEADNFAVAWYTWPNTHYSTDWAQGGPIIEREIESLYEHKPLECWAAKSKQGDLRYGPTPLIAAMRCYVASKLGDTVQIPKELAQ